MKKSIHKTNTMSRAALYMRVSTGAQAKKDLSVPDQRKSLREFCASREWVVVDEFTDARTGRDDNRPGFQRMMDAALHGQAPFDVIVVHSFSRFFRNEIELGLYARNLQKRGIRLVSMTQDFGDDPVGVMLRQILALFDEHSSLETAKHVARSMAENARQGYFNGGVVPFGFESVEVEKRGSASKKKLVPKEDEAEVVRLAFRLYLTGDGSSGPLGVKKLTEWLNDHGYRTRRGAKWGIGQIHRMLTDPIHKGDYWRSRDSDDPILIAVPPIMTVEDFDRVQVTLKSRNPKKVPPRTVSSPVLLSGLATCAACGNGMIQQTGKSGKYRYYYCGGRIRQGRGTCEGRRVRMKETDDAVMEAITNNLLPHERVEGILRELHERQSVRAIEAKDKLAKHEARLNEAKTKLSRLIKLVEDGLMDSSDQIFRDRLQHAKDDFRIAQTQYQRIRKKSFAHPQINRQQVSKLRKALKENLHKEDPKFRRAYLRAAISRIEFEDHGLRLYRRGGSVPTGFAARNGTVGEGVIIPLAYHPGAPEGINAMLPVRSQ